jgi:thioredoxin reductase
MGTWREGMPVGMSLKSEGFASDLYHPDGHFKLRDYCRETGIPYADIGIPVELETFYSYGKAFQERFVSDLEDSLVTCLTKSNGLFEVTLDTGMTVTARQVIIAAGIGHYPYLPPQLIGLPTTFVSHSSQYHRFEMFSGRDVIVGAGSSAIDVAVALSNAGARPQLLTRRPKISFHGKAPDRRPLLTRIKAPWSGLGPGWRSRLCCDMPLLFHAMPLEFRAKVVKKHLGPAPGWFTREKVVGRIPMHVGLSLEDAEVSQNKVSLKLRTSKGETTNLSADHVIAGTGYRVNLEKLGFLTEEVRQHIITEHGSPRLSSHFESSVEGLYFVGTPAALSFGPLLRFAFGAGFAASRISRHLAVQVRRSKRKASVSERTVGQPFLANNSQPDV